MAIRKLLIANRGEVAIRVARAASELGIVSVAVFSQDDASSLHLRKTDESYPLGGNGASAYLDVEGIIVAAKKSGCDGIHPGYGFLSEDVRLAARCADEGLVFVGPSTEMLRLFGNKTAARALAQRLGIAVIHGTSGPTTLKQATAFFDSLGPGAGVMIKAGAGGGGRGTRPVWRRDELEQAYARCQSEAKTSFGDDSLYVERLLPDVRHIEVQIAGDRTGAVSHLFERECTLQRRNQKLIEIAPSPSLPPALRERITLAARELAVAAKYDSLGTFEFLIDADLTVPEPSFAFIEANPRLQVEHTVTEEVLGIDLVKTQLELASGRTLADLGLLQPDVPNPRGFAIELRVNMETMDKSGATKPSGGTISAFEPPCGRGIRLETCGYAGYRTNASFDSLLAKLIVHIASPRFSEALDKASRALCEFRIEGVATNIPFLQALLQSSALREDRVSTRFVDEHIGELVKAAAEVHRELFFRLAPERTGAVEVVDRAQAPLGTIAVPAPIQGTIVTLDVSVGDLVRPGQIIAVLESMKMEHLVTADNGGVVRLVAAAKGDTLMPGQSIAFIEPVEMHLELVKEVDEVASDELRPDLAEVLRRHANTLDENRPDAVAKRRKNNQRTARENVEQLCDPGSFTEYGALAIAAQRRRRGLDDLIKRTPADGVIVGTATINAGHFGPEAARCLVVAYDYTVLAGTQGQMNHKKQDRMFGLAERWTLPVVIYTEGGGGRPGDTDRLGMTGLDVPTFARFAKLSGQVPLVGVVSGYCFAGNAALLGCCDVIIATKNASIGMGGPAMIEGGGLGVYRPADVGPTSFQAPNGVIDILVEDEVEATETARKYLSYFQGPLKDWTAVDQRLLRHAIPENRLRVYDIRKLIRVLADEGSVLELRAAFGVGMITAFIRIEGQPMGLIANNSQHLGGAIDTEAGDKAARFMQLCNTFDIPILSLCDTPGFMVGPEAEKTALVRHVCRMFVTGANSTVPFLTVVLRKGYGLGAQAMAAGSFHSPLFTVAWPTGEFGGMGLEGYVRLGYRKEMEAIADPAERQAYYEKLVAKRYEEGKAISIASVLEIDDVIDPAETRRWIIRGLCSTPKRQPGSSGKRSFVDSW